LLGGYGLVLAALALMVFGAIECPLTFMGNATENPGRRIHVGSGTQIKERMSTGI